MVHHRVNVLNNSVRIIGDVVHRPRRVVTQTDIEDVAVVAFRQSAERKSEVVRGF